MSSMKFEVDMERALLFSGIGGQGVQLAGRTLGRAALLEGRFVLVFGTYGGEMRGGDTDVTLVIGDRPLLSPPVVDHCWGALVMHHRNWAPIQSKLESGGIALVDSSVFRGDDCFDGHTLRVDATRQAADAGMRRAGSMVALGAFVAATGLVGLDSLLAAAAEVLPTYRSDFIEPNRQALSIGYNAVREIIVPAELAEVVAA